MVVVLILAPLVVMALMLWWTSLVEYRRDLNEREAVTPALPVDDAAVDAVPG